MLAPRVLHDPQGTCPASRYWPICHCHSLCPTSAQFWNVKLTSKLSTTPSASNNASTASSMYDAGKGDDEATETPESLRSKQTRMENQVDQIWKVLSAFEESSAGCISEMLRFVSSGQYLEAIVMAERFILHVEILFAAIDDLEAQFALEKVKGEPARTSEKA